MASSGDYGSYIPSTQVWDVSEVYSTEVTSPAFKELLVRMYQNLNLLSLVVNQKDTGIYNDVDEFVNGQTYFPSATTSSSTYSEPVGRNVFRKVVNFGELPNTASKSVAHGITMTDGTTFTRIYGAATNTTAHAYIPLPYASPTLASSIELSVDGTNVTIITGSNRSSFDVTYVVLEYLKF